MKAALAVMSLPYSDVIHVTAYPRECTETLRAVHDTLIIKSSLFRLRP